MINKYGLLKYVISFLTFLTLPGCAINSTISFNGRTQPLKEIIVLKTDVKDGGVVKTPPVIKNPEEKPIENKSENKTRTQDKINKIFVGCRKFQKPEIPPEIIINSSEIMNLNDQEIIKKLLDHIKKTRQQYLLILKKYNESMVDHLKSCKN